MEYFQQLALLLDPFVGLSLSLFFCFLFLRRFERTTERLFTVFETELELCHHRCDFLLTEMMKLKHREADPH